MLAQETVNILNNQPLVKGSKTTFSREFPLAQGWYKMNLRFRLAVTAGTAAGPITEAALLFIKNIFLKTDRGEIICNLPGRALYNIAATKSECRPQLDTVTNADGTYYVTIPIWFVDPRLTAGEPTILDTARYNALTLDVQIGSEADLFTTPGTSSVVTTLDCEVLRTKDVLPAEFAPLAFVNYEYAQPQDASVQTYVDIERSQDLSIKRLYVHSGGSATAGVPFSGANDEAIIDTLSFSDSAGYIEQLRIAAMVQNENKEKYSLETRLSAIYIMDLVRNGDIESSLWTGDRAKLQVHWENMAGVVAGDQVSVAVEGVRGLK